MPGPAAGARPAAKDMPYETSNVHVPGAGVGVGDRPGRNDMSSPSARAGMM